jgi:hypothetical protein
MLGAQKGHRSHFGSRYKLGCCGHAGLFGRGFDSSSCRQARRRMRVKWNGWRFDGATTMRVRWRISKWVRDFRRPTLARAKDTRQRHKQPKETYINQNARRWYLLTTQRSLHPVLSCCLCTAHGTYFCLLCCQPVPVRRLSCARTAPLTPRSPCAPWAC